MSAAPLNLIAPLLYTHLVAAKRPEDHVAMFNAFRTACDAWDDHFEQMMEFTGGPVPLKSRTHDSQFYCMLILHLAKMNFEKEALSDASMHLTEKLWEESGLSVDDFVLLIEDGELQNLLRNFLNEYSTIAVGERTVQ